MCANCARSSSGPVNGSRLPSQFLFRGRNQVGLRALHGFAEIALTHNVVPVKDAACFVAAHRHGNALWKESGETLQFCRKRADLTAEQLAQRVGCSVDVVRNIENGRTKLRAELADAFWKVITEALSGKRLRWEPGLPQSLLEQAA